jgi:hypothetical protein
MSAGERVFDPETLNILKAVFDEAYLALPPGQHTSSLRTHSEEKSQARADAIQSGFVHTR